MESRGATSVIRYMDDFLTIASTHEGCQASLDIMLTTCRLAGFEVQPSKVTRPDCVIEFLGIIIDSSKRELRISEERLEEITYLLQQWNGRSVCTKRELLSLIGKLMFAARVVRSGRTFLGRLIHLSKKVRHLHHRVRISPAAKADIAWWQRCLSSHNGIAAFPAAWVSENTHHIYTDASDLAISGVWHK